MTWAGLQGTGVSAYESEAESQRFGCRMSRLVVGATADATPELATRLTTELRDSPADIVVARWPGQHTGLPAAAAASGRVILPADMLLYWEVPATTLASMPLGETDLTTSVGGAGDIGSVVEQVVVDSFRGYGNHYSANPLLDDDLALAGYVEWARRATEASPENLVTLWSGTTPIGLATLAHDGADLEIELAGIIGSAQGKGAYSYLTRAVGEHALALGCDRVIISTQAHNVRVQRSWTRAGYKPFAAVQTIHAITPGFWAAGVAGY